MIRRDGLVFIRNTFSGRLDGIRHYEFFPSARAIDEARLPRVERVREAFEARGFSTVALDSEFARGLALIRAAVDREADPIPVREKVDLLVLRRSRDEPLR